MTLNEALDAAKRIEHEKHTYSNAFTRRIVIEMNREIFRLRKQVDPDNWLTKKYDARFSRKPIPALEGVRG